MSIDSAIATLEEVARVDLERCETAIRKSDKEVGIAAIELAFAKIDTVIDLLRSLPRRMEP
jgi:hypothetical protein